MILNSSFLSNLTIGIAGGSSTPAILDDGNTVGWYIAGESYATLDGTSVTAWLDQSGNENHLAPAAPETAPTLVEDTIVFNGVDQYLINSDLGWAAYDEVGSNMVYLVFKANSWRYSEVVFSKIAGSGSLTFQLTGSSGGNLIRIYSSSGSSSGSSTYNTGSWHIATVLVDGVNSRFAIDDETPLTASTGSNKLGGMILGASSVPDYHTQIDVKELICRKITDTESDEDAIYTYLKAKYEL